MSKCFVIATLGTSPAVLSELVYALVTAEQYSVEGLEVWTTLEGFKGLKKWIEAGTWQRLSEALRGRGFDRPLPDPGLQTVELSAVAQAVRRGQRPFLIRIFDASGVELEDVRSPDDARAMDAKLFERVRVLTQELGDVQLIGSLAGGRKTMSAGLQGAFSMLGREGDRLVHVLLEPRVEEHVRKHLDFAFPCVEVAQVTGVGLNEQITLHDVHFPRLLDLLRRGRLQHQAIVDLIAEDYPTFLRSMSRCQARRTATLQRSARTAFFYTVVVDGDDREPQVVTLSQAVGHTLAALIEVGGRASLKELQGALAKHDSVKNDEIDRNAVSQRLKELERALKDFPRLGLSEFALSRPARSQYLVEAAVEGLITVDPHDLWD